MFEQTAAVFFVLALVIATLWFLRRKGLASLNLAFSKRRTGSKQVQVVERVALTAHHSLHLIRVQNRLILIGVSPSGCNQIESFADCKADAGPGENQ